MAKKLYSIPVVYQMWGIVKVEAESLEEAGEKVLTEGGLPSDPSYIDDSIQIDFDSVCYGATEDVEQLKK